MAEQMLMKNGLNKQAISRIAKGIWAVYSDFDIAKFENDCVKGLAKLELKERVLHIIVQLQKHLPQDFKKTAVILQTLPEHWDKGDINDPLRGFAIWPVTDYVAIAGLEYPEEALESLEKLTPLFSAEFAIRPFIQSHPKVTLRYMKHWLTHGNDQVRRLVSEGTRPRLPWGMRLQNFVKDPSPIIPLLEKLKNDESLYVRRSVANNLNDIAKDHPDKVLDLCTIWQKELEVLSEKNLEKKENVLWLIRHATRTLVKQGHPKSFILLGYTDKPDIKVGKLKLNKRNVKMGEVLEFCFDISSNQINQKFVVDYAVHYKKANGKTSSKVFKLKNCILDKGETLTLNKKIDFKPITTRKYYSGEHIVVIHINGIEKAKGMFNLDF